MDSDTRNSLPLLDPVVATRALGALGSQYVPRTRHLDDSGKPRFSNRLLLETSPYLQQHAHNPVNWFPWGEEAFALARQLNRPILLSVGYSTCHWCHVMEEESFEDESVAKLLNDLYIPVKVDREERPDVDAVYMAAVQAMTGHGGWPMTVWLLPDQRPYYGGTYFPPRDGGRGARVGFSTILMHMRRLYDEEPDRLVTAAQELTGAVRKQLEISAAESTQGNEATAPNAACLARAQDLYSLSFDEQYAGLGQAPKFPSSLPVRLLLRLGSQPVAGTEASASQRYFSMALKTLDAMAKGGIYDHIAGGFHRYSVDREWLVPHFEKMLYDNALLTSAYVDAYQLTGNTRFKRVACEVLDYLMREMSAPEGGFYSATDADSEIPDSHGEREEGFYFSWTPEELSDVLGPEEAKVFAEVYGVTDEGNFEGRSLLSMSRMLDTETPDDAKLQARLAQAKQRLYAAREKRPAPLRDNKILAAWNGLTISALAQAAFVFANKSHEQRAIQAATFIWQHMTTKTGASNTHERRLYRLYQPPQSQRPPLLGYLEDYACVIQGYLDLFDTVQDARWLQAAIDLQASVDTLFLDTEHGGYFSTSDEHEKLLVREKPSYDGATPSGNSITASNLLRLYTLTEKDSYQTEALRIFQALRSTLERAPTALSEMLLAVHRFLSPAKEIVITGEPAARQAFTDAVRQTFLPYRTLVVAGDPTLATLTPLLHQRSAQEAKAYVCEQGTCQLPTTDVTVFKQQMAIGLTVPEN